MKIGLEEHREIILEALQDYRKWWLDFNHHEERVERIDKAIEFVRGAE